MDFNLKNLYEGSLEQCLLGHQNVRLTCSPVARHALDLSFRGISSTQCGLYCIRSPLHGCEQHYSATINLEGLELYIYANTVGPIQMHKLNVPVFQNTVHTQIASSLHVFVQYGPEQAWPLQKNYGETFWQSQGVILSSCRLHMGGIQITSYLIFSHKKSVFVLSL